MSSIHPQPGGKGAPLPEAPLPAPRIPTADEANLEWIRRQYRNNLIEKVRLSYFVKSPPDFHPPVNSPNARPHSYRVSLAEMQRMRIQRLQYQLAIHARNLYEGSVENWDDWESDLQSYVQALQEHEYMEMRGGESRDPFLITGERQVDRDILDTVMKNISPPAGRSTPVLSWETKRVSPVATRRGNRANKRFMRMGVAAVGAAFLIAPMWLCILVLDTHQALWTTTIFVAVFGVMMAFVLHDNIAVLSATAAYAAVLVVFVALVAEKDQS
ncbi:hypothetical protein CDV36_000086 [Fusarium kuroshium]|uniref:DUF6594 domain-containing protein n=1 Tax=Fusarium kuroshium TaxID=2010991 RepID=A0A3M2SRW0_9HYPO|nr:hypothetical protein CDV36_000086 [Fusarium kuroshium]